MWRERSLMKNRIPRSAYKLKRTALAVVLGACLAHGGVAMAQSTTGSISGTVPVGSSVTISNNSGLTRTIAADANGRYNAGNLPVGNYTVTAGGSKREVLVTVGNNINVSFGGDTSTLETVTVTAANAAPIDVTTVSTSTVITAQELARLPLARSAEAIALLAPGAVGGNSVYFGKSVSLGGASVAENAYYINGFFTGNPMTNIGGYTLPYGSIEQQETYTGGYSARYGRSDGGVINQIGKSGTNEFHFGAQVTWSPKSLREGTPDRHLPNDKLPPGYAYEDDTLPGTLFSRGDRSNQSWNATYSAYVSGPLIKDRLFGFISAEQDKTDADTFPTVQGNPRVLKDSTKNPKMYAKLNWNITDNHLLEATYMAQRYRYGGDYYAYNFDDDTLGGLTGAKVNEERENDEFSIIKYTGYLTDNLTLNAMYGHSRLSYSSIPTLTGFAHVTSANLQNPAYWPAGTPSSGITNPQAASNGTPAARDYSDGLRVEAEYVLGRHTLTAGIDNQKFEAKNEGVDMLVDRWIYARTNAPNNPINRTLNVGG